MQQCMVMYRSKNRKMSPIWRDFRQLQTSIANISGKGQDIQNRKEMCSPAILPAFPDKSPIYCVKKSNTYSHWKCIYPHFVFGAKLGVTAFCNFTLTVAPYVVLALLTTTIGPPSTGFVTAVFGPSNWKYITEVKMGQNRGRMIGFWHQTKVFFTFRAPNVCAKFHQKE